jgi:hypothetical protein
VSASANPRTKVMSHLTQNNVIQKCSQEKTVSMAYFADTSHYFLVPFFGVSSTEKVTEIKHRPCSLFKVPSEIHMFN